MNRFNASLLIAILVLSLLCSQFPDANKVVMTESDTVQVTYWVVVATIGENELLASPTYETESEAEEFRDNACRLDPTLNLHVRPLKSIVHSD